ncbi:hypothetical protein BH10PSE13_BH10PSE13_13040 [soil metagenome]
MPVVSVVIPTYRRTDKLLRAVGDALRQTISDVEVVVHVVEEDRETIAALSAIEDPRVRWVVSPVKDGAGPARNRAAAASTGPWIAFLDDDDEWMPHKLERQLAMAGQDRIVTCLSRVVTETLEYISPGRPYDGSRSLDEWLFDRHSWMGGGEAMVQTSSLLVPAGLMRELPFATSRHDDWEFVIRASRVHGYRLVTVEEPLVIYYAGARTPWRPAIGWAESMADVMSPRALSGFCLNSATQAVGAEERSTAFLTLLRAGLRLGRPTPKQLFAFFAMWAVPHEARWRLRQWLSTLRR